MYNYANFIIGLNQKKILIIKLRFQFFFRFRVESESALGCL